jgi:hypothetical protein
LVFAGLKAMAAEAMRDRAAAIGVAVVALVLLGTAWILAVMALVSLAQSWLGPVGGLAAVAGGLVVLALAIVGLTRAQNRRSAESRAVTRALWTSTAINAASMFLRREPQVRPEPEPVAAGSANHRSALLILGGLALILLAFLLPSGKDGEAEEGGAEGGADGGGPDGTA